MDLTHRVFIKLRQIQYANSHHQPFLAISGGHGLTWTLGTVQNGIGIAMRGMVFVHISDDGSSATIGGGTESGEVIAALWAQGKQTSTFPPFSGVDIA